MHLSLYGSGHRCEILLDIIKETDILIDKIIDSNPVKWGSIINGYTVESPESLRDCGDSFICVTFFGENDYEPIWDELENDYGIKRERILPFNDVIKRIYLKQIDIPMFSVKKGMGRKTIFAGAWNFEIGGVETWIGETVARLALCDKEVYVLSKHDQIELPVNRKDCLIEYCIEDSCGFSKESAQKTVEKLIGLCPCTIICSRVDEVLLAAYLIKQKNPESIRIIMAVHGACDGMVRDIFSYDEAIEKYVCVSNATKNGLLRIGTKREKCEVINTPIKYCMESERTYSEEEDRPLCLGYVGRIEVFHKRADLLIKLIQCLEKNKVNYSFEIAGEGGFLSALSSFIEKNHLSGKVKYLGVLNREEVFEFWQRKDVAINVSDSEGRPVSNIEAMLCGAVPVVTATPGILEDVENGVTGFTVNIGDYEAMANVIVNLDENRKMLRMIGEKARERMREKTDVEAYVGHWNEILRIGESE